MDSAEASPTPSIPADDESPFEVRNWIVSVLLTPPALCSDDEAETLAGKFHGTGLELKAATIGDLQSPSCLGTDAGLRVFERIENSQGAWESMLSSLRKTTKAWGLDIIPANAGSAEASRKGSIAAPEGSILRDEDIAKSKSHLRQNSQGTTITVMGDLMPDVRKNSTVELADGVDSQVTRRRSSTHE